MTPRIRHADHPHDPGAGAGAAIEEQVDLWWRRSASCGLTPESARPGAPDSAGIRSHRLAEAARPVLDGLDGILRGTGAQILVGDRDGQIIRTVKDSGRVAQMLARRGVEEGAMLGEDAVGNNGIGTPLETRSGVSIRGEQHFADTLKDFVCYGHPIVDPLTRRLVGAVDLSGMDADDSRMFAPFVRKIVADIEARYVDTARADDRELWHRFVERTRLPNTATCAFGDEVVLASHSSLERLDSRDMVTLRRLVERDEVGETIRLSAGLVGVVVSRVGSRGHLLDLTFPADDARPRTAGPGRTIRRPGEFSGTAETTTPVRQVSASPTASTTTGGPGPAHAVVGPAGSGRTTTARALAGAQATHVRLAEADDAVVAWRELAAPALREQRGPLVLDDIDLLDDVDLRRLAARIARHIRGASRTGPAPDSVRVDGEGADGAVAPGTDGSGVAGADVVVVTCRDAPRPAVTEVLDACAERTAVRPLHERGDEGTAIVTAMLADLCAERGIAEPEVSARFSDTVCSADLPHGLVSLRSILAECLDHGSARLDVDALPVRARSARPPRSGELARGEYDAIVAALAECDGVRARAATRLGISRTTLYARMREFGLS